MSEIDLSKAIGKRVRTREGALVGPVHEPEPVYSIGNAEFYENGQYCKGDTEHPWDIVEIIPDDPPTPKWEIGKPYRLRGSNRLAVVLAKTPHGKLFGYYYDEGNPDNWVAYTWEANGHTPFDGEPHALDLMPDTPPVPEKRVGWLNVYWCQREDHIHPTEGIARNAADKYCLGTVRVEYEVPPQR